VADANQNKRRDAQVAILDNIITAAGQASPSRLRDLAEAYALATGQAPATIRGKLES
jgi:hypothetical protein